MILLEIKVLVEWCTFLVVDRSVMTTKINVEIVYIRISIHNFTS